MGQATHLYKQLLRYGQTLKLTDRNYFYRRIRFEFEKNSILQEQQELVFQLEKARQFLKNKRLV